MGLGTEHILRRTLEPLKDVFEFAEGDALLALFKAVQGADGNAELPGELGIRQLASLLPKKGGQRFVEGLAHAATLAEPPFRMRKVCLNPEFGFVASATSVEDNGPQEVRMDKRMTIKGFCEVCEGINRDEVSKNGFELQLPADVDESTPLKCPKGHLLSLNRCLEANGVNYWPQRFEPVIGCNAMLWCIGLSILTILLFYFSWTKLAFVAAVPSVFLIWLWIQSPRLDAEQLDARKKDLQQACSQAAVVFEAEKSAMKAAEEGRQAAEEIRKKRVAAASRILTSSDQFIRGRRIKKQLRVIRVDGCATDDEADLELRAKALEIGADALINVRFNPYPGGRFSAHGDAVELQLEQA